MYSGVKYADTSVLKITPKETAIKAVAKPAAKDQFKYETGDKLPQSASFFDKQQTKESKRRADWQANHLAIERAMLMMIRRSDKLPTNLQIAETTGLSERAIRNHLEYLNLSEMFVFARRQYAPLADEVMKSITRQAITGTGRAQELYFGLVFGWRRGQTLELETPDLETPEERHERI